MTTSLRRSYPRIAVLTLTAVLSSGAVAPTANIHRPPAPWMQQTCCTSLLLTGYVSTGQTDGHRTDTQKLEAASVNNQ